MCANFRIADHSEINANEDKMLDEAIEDLSCGLLCLPDFNPGVENSMSTSEKPKPIITGDSQAQGIAKFASRVTYEDLTPERRERLKVSVLDSLACAINAVGVPPTVACLEQAKQFGGSDARCTLIGGGKANVVYAAQYNTALVRYIDFMDSYLGGGGTLSPVGQRWGSLGRVRARGTIRQRILGRPGSCLPSRVGTNCQRSIHGRRV